MESLEVKSISNLWSYVRISVTLKIFWLISLLLFIPAGVVPCLALQPEEVLLVVNRNNPASIKLAEYYRTKRHIPEANLISVDMPDEEDCRRDEYQQKLVVPLRNYLKRQRDIKIRCVLLFYGIPLRVAAPELSGQQWGELKGLQHTKKQIDWQLENGDLTEKERHQYQAKRGQVGTEISQLSRNNQRAAVDSELSLLLNDGYVLDGWLPNPFFVGFQNQPATIVINKDQVLFVARLDASSPEIVRRMIDDSIYAEQRRLQGRAYFDARWLKPEQKKLKGYALYDASIHKAAELTSKISALPVHLDQQERLLQPGEAPNAALYCGWYSLGKYIDAFTWQRGAVGYHIASSECTTLKKEKSEVWCKRMLEDGAAATIGPVAEPYVQGFPLPELFFGFLLDGYYTLVESYYLSLPFLSWQMVLIGDPLYRPFRNVKAVN